MAGTPQLPLDLQVERAPRFENYWTAASDPVVPVLRAHALGYPDAAPAAARETVVFVWGTAGAGKSHLLHSSVHWARSHGRPACHVGPDEVVRGVCVDGLALLCVDDVDGFAGDLEAERNLLDVFESLRASGAQLVVSADRPPAAVAFGLADLQSRLMWGPVLRIDPLSDEALRLHFRAHADRYGLHIPDDVVEYVARRCPRDAAYLEALAEALHRQSLAEKRRVSIPMVARVTA
ncbi:MAG: DnaA/Hda family protein [Pseudomonadota bacterium]